MWTFRSGIIPKHSCVETTSYLVPWRCHITVHMKTAHKDFSPHKPMLRQSVRREAMLLWLPLCQGQSCLTGINMMKENPECTASDLYFDCPIAFQGKGMSFWIIRLRYSILSYYRGSQAPSLGFWMILLETNSLKQALFCLTQMYRSFLVALVRNKRLRTSLPSFVNQSQWEAHFSLEQIPLCLFCGKPAQRCFFYCYWSKTQCTIYLRLLKNVQKLEECFLPFSHSCFWFSIKFISVMHTFDRGILQVGTLFFFSLPLSKYKQQIHSLSVEHYF